MNETLTKPSLLVPLVSIKTRFNRVNRDAGRTQDARTGQMARKIGHAQGTGHRTRARKTPKNQQRAKGNDPPPHRKKSVFVSGLASPNRYIAQTLLVFNSYI